MAYGLASAQAGQIEGAGDGGHASVVGMQRVAAVIGGMQACGIGRVAHHRIQGSPMMAEVAERFVLPALRAAGLEAAIETFPSDGTARLKE